MSSESLYYEIPLHFDEAYDAELGDVRISLTPEGYAALAAQVGECPCCKRIIAEGVPH